MFVKFYAENTWDIMVNKTLDWLPSYLLLFRRNRRGSGSSDDSYARGKQDFYDLPPEVQKTMVKYAKGSKRGLADDEDTEWLRWVGFG